MEEAIRTEEYKGFDINFYQDLDPESPREWDNLGKMVCFHRNYTLGDKHDFAEADELTEFVAKEDIISLPLYLYDHSGIWMSTNGRRYPFNCPWDSGQVGYIYVTKDDLRKEYGVKHVTKAIIQKAINVLSGEVNTYNKYISGDVYGYVIEDADGETLDSCWGYYDEVDNTIKECQSIIDAHIQEANKIKHYPKVEVFVTKGCVFRARIRESIEQPSYEVSVGGEEWGKGKGKNHEAAIKLKMQMIVGSLSEQINKEITEERGREVLEEMKNRGNKWG